MKKVLLGVWLVAVFFSGTAHSEAGIHYLLPKFGLMSVDLNDADPVLSVGLMYGIGLTETMSFEAEVNSGFSGGEFQESNNTKGEYRIQTYAGYLSYRHPVKDTAYLKGKLGLLKEEVTVEVNKSDGTRSRKTRDEGVAGGVGAGVALGNRLTLEVELTVIDKDINFYSLGTHYRF